MSVLVPVADGSEEIETVCVVDTLVRAGAKVTIASVTDSLTVVCSRGVKLVADAMISDVAGTEFDCIAVPGGMPGAKTISESAAFIGMLKAHCAAGKLYGAICAAPAVCLAEHKLIPDGALATCHPGFAAKLAEAIGSSRCSEERVVVSAEHKFVTSRGPGTAIEFALALATILFDEQKAKDVAAPMLVK